MGKQRNRFLNFVNRYSPGKPFTEATATVALSRWLFKGHGEKHLSFPVPEDGIGRSINAGPRRFSCPTTGVHYARWLPFRDHVLGDEKGIVSDAKTTTVPFIAVDLDRHSGDIRAAEHQMIVLEAGRFLCHTFPHIKWLAEVNPRNGSSKFFGFNRNGDQYARSEAQKLSSRIRQELIHNGLCHKGNVEVFPENCHAVFLPLRRDKITIIDGGVLPRCTRKTRDVTYFPERVFEPIRCYSALHFMAWIYRGDNYDEGTLVAALQHSCANLPDDTTSKETSSSDHSAIASSPAGSVLPVSAPTQKVAISTEYNTEEPNAFKRNWDALLPFSRQFFKSNHRLPSTDEALTYLNSNRLYSGTWSTNEVNRRHRVNAILTKIKETFDPSLLISKSPVAFDQNVSRWCRRKFPHGLVARQRIINQMEMSCRFRVIRIPSRFIEHCVGVIAFCLNNHLENQALPVNRIKAIWSLVGNAPSWNQEYFQIVRSELERIRFIEIYDKNHESGKAWRWRKGPAFPGIKKRSSGTVSVSKRPSAAGAREKRERDKRRITYNSLYHTAVLDSGIGCLWKALRGPPNKKSDHLATSALRQVTKSEKIPCSISMN